MKKRNKLLTIISLLIPSTILGGTLIGVYAFPSKKSALSVSKYENYVEKLGLNKFTKLSELTNEKLTNKLHADYPQLSVKILDGSDEASGTLILEFSGQDNGNDIVDGKSTITDFENYDEDTSFSLQDIKVNLDNWFKNQLPIKKSTKGKVDVSGINTNNLLTNLISSANIAISKNNSETNTIPLKEGMKFLKGLSIESINETSNNSYSLKLSSPQLNFKRFDGTNWNHSEVRTLKTDSSKDNIFPIPTLSDLEDHILKQITVKDSASTSFNNYYPSYFESKWEVAKAMSFKGQSYDLGLRNFTNYSEIENKYRNYLEQEPKTTLIFKVDTNENALTADDYQGNLDFKMQLKAEDSSDNRKEKPITKKFNLSGMKKISNFISEKNKEINEFMIVKDKAFFFYEKVLEIIQKDFQFSAFLYEFGTNSKAISINAEKLKGVLEFVNGDGYVFNAGDNEDTAKSRVSNLMNWNDILYLFNKTLSINNHHLVGLGEADCSLYNKKYSGRAKYKDDVGPEILRNLYKCKNDDGKNALIINSIKYTFDQTNNKIEFTLTRNQSNNSSMNVAFNGKAIVGFSKKPNETNEQYKEFNTKFIVNNLVLNNFKPGS